jgi:DNA (cytosine-5)-methyltransferase 1
MKLLDLFSGIGGFSLAARWANIETIQFVEKDKFCRKVLEKNFPNVPIHDDIRTFDFHQDVEILTGGFPCQPFSIAGKKKGILDDRYLWPEMFRIIKQCKPAYIIAENVAGLISMLDPILEDLENESYRCQSYLIPASLIGAPHKRERLWIVAYRNRERCHSGGGYREARQIFENLEQHVEKIQQEWSQFIPDTWETLTARDWFQYNRKLCRGDDGLSNRVDRIKSLGNAIVPQIAYGFLKAIVLHGTPTNSLNIGT